MFFEQVLNIKLYELMLLSATPFVVDQAVRAIFRKGSRAGRSESDISSSDRTINSISIPAAPILQSSEAMTPSAAPIERQVFDQLALLDGQKKPVVRLGLLSEEEMKRSGKRLRKLDLSSINARHLNPVISALPTLGFSTALNSGNLMKVIVDGPLHPGQITGTLSPVVRNSTGSIKSWAVLKDPRALKNVANVAAVWQIASVIMAQKHLADIDRKLRVIEKGIDDIKNFLDSQRISVITGTLSYLKQANSSVAHGDLNPLFREKMESFEVDLLRVQNHLLSELQKRVSNIAKIENNSFLKLGNKSLISDIEAAQEELESTLSTWLLCIQARAACWQVLSAYPGEIHLKVLRQNDIKDSISQVLHTDGLTREIRVALLDAIGKIDGVLNKAELAKRREIFGEQILNCLDNFSIKAIEVQNKVDEVGATLLSYEKQPLQIIIRMKNDEVFEIMEIS